MSFLTMSSSSECGYRSQGDLAQSVVASADTADKAEKKRGGRTSYIETIKLEKTDRYNRASDY